ncbi:MAG: hypothetical protein ACI8QS_003400 [Planctomycetota bacterium]|jgi:hypothetical protein
METQPSTPPSRFHWNKGSWLGSQVGSTLWMGLLGLTLLAHDTIAGISCLAIFLGLNVWGWSLWRRREQRTAFGAMRIFMIVCIPAFTLAVVVVNSRSGARNWDKGSILETGLPYWIAGVPAAMLLVLHFRERG